MILIPSSVYIYPEWPMTQRRIGSEAAWHILAALGEAPNRAIRFSRPVFLKRPPGKQMSCALQVHSKGGIRFYPWPKLLMGM